MRPHRSAQLARINSPILVQGEVALRPLLRGDYPAWAQAVAADEAHLRAVQPTWPANHLTELTFRRRVRRFEKMSKRLTGFSFAVAGRRTGEFFGALQLAPITYGPSRSATLGYWIAGPHRRQGLGRAAVQIATRFATEQLNLSRIEAHCLPENAASISVLEAAGFQREGVLVSFLEIDGERRDHVLYARTA